jgi:hypothetical protein
VAKKTARVKVLNSPSEFKPPLRGGGGRSRGEREIPVSIAAHRDSLLVLEVLDFRHALGAKAFRPVLDIEFDLVPLIEVPVTVTNDRFVMDEHIVPRLSADKAKSFGLIEPLDCSAFHGTYPFIKVLLREPQPAVSSVYDL